MTFQHRNISVPVWNTDVHVFIGGTEAQWRKIMLHEKASPEHRDYWIERMGGKDSGALTMFSEDAPWHVWAYWPKLPRLHHAEDMGAVTHEMMHATFAILRRKGVTLTPESEESFTYLAEFLVREFLAAFYGKR